MVAELKCRNNHTKSPQINKAVNIKIVIYERQTKRLPKFYLITSIVVFFFMRVLIVRNYNFPRKIN